MINYTTLKTELTTNPNGYTGIGGQTLTQLYNAGADQACADVLNEIRAAISIKRADVSSADCVSSIRVTDYTALPANPSNGQLSTERRFLSWLECISGLVEGRIRLLNDDGSDTPAIANFKDMFQVGTGTLTRLLALATRSGSRAEQLFGADTRLTATDIVQARNS